MTFSVAIRTVPQRAELFVGLWLRLQQMIMSCSLVHGVHVSSSTEVTPNENGCRALLAAHADETEWVIFLEDDAGPIDDFFPSVERWLIDWIRPDVHVYPLGCQYAEEWPTKGVPPAWEYPLSAYYCSVALAIRSSQIPSLVDYFRRQGGVRQGFDLYLARWHNTVSSSKYLVTPIPCFVEHLGDDSTLIDGRSERNVVGRFRGFRGYDFVYKGGADGGQS